MGGQACILYGGAEFSRDIDFAIAVDPANLRRLRQALGDLGAEPIFVPALSAAVLRRGHACHFRCLAPGMSRLRIDVMGKMRGAPPFSRLWKRRNEVDLPGVGRIGLVSLEDLVRIKKTQRDKDWLMLRRLVEADLSRRNWEGDAARISFWLRECRSPALLVELVRRFPVQARSGSRRRPALGLALRGKAAGVRHALEQEERLERRADRAYWRPLRQELEDWRMGRDRT